MKTKQELGGETTAKILREKAIEEYYKKPNHCLFCGMVICVGKYKVSYIKSKKFCSQSCGAKFNNKTRYKGKKQKLEKKKIIKIDFLTKKELFDRRKNYQSARGSIQTRSIKVYNESDKPKCCFICGYGIVYHVAHIKSVSSFDNSCFIYEINSLDNLVALCPNHHAEFDLGLIEI